MLEQVPAVAPPAPVRLPAYPAVVMPPVVASPPNVNVARAPPVPVPVACETSFPAGTVWHSLQASAVARQRVPVTCAPCAPTAAAVGSVLPRVSAEAALKPGAAAGRPDATPVWVRSPWQSVQPERLRFTVPSTCVAWTTVVDA